MELTNLPYGTWTIEVERSCLSDLENKTSYGTINSMLDPPHPFSSHPSCTCWWVLLQAHLCVLLPASLVHKQCRPGCWDSVPQGECSANDAWESGGKYCTGNNWDAGGNLLNSASSNGFFAFFSFSSASWIPSQINSCVQTLVWGQLLEGPT